MSEQLAKHVLDVASAGVAIATVAKWLPEIAALFTVIWTGLRIWDEIARRWGKRKRR